MNPDTVHLMQYPLLTAMLTPALFLTAAGALLTNANNRLARISDRLREHLANVANMAEVSTTMHDRVNLMRKRAHLALSAIQRLHFAIGMFVATSLTIAVDAMASLHLPQLPTALAMTGVLVLLGAAVQLWREARLGVQSLELMISAMRPVSATKPATTSEPPPTRANDDESPGGL